MTGYTYSARNELLTETFPGPTGGTRSYTYDPAGRLHTRTDQRGITTTYAYDAANRLTGRTYSDGTADGFTLDAAGRVLTASAGRSGVKVERAYTSGLLVSETLRWLVGQDGAPQATTVNYAHDDVGRVKTVTYSDGRTLERTFTPRGQVEGLTFGGTQVATLARDTGGRRTGTAFANGLTDTRTYRADNRLAGTSVAPTAGGEAQLALGYSYDANKRKTAETDGRKPAQSQSFGYDAQDRMTDWRLSDVADPDGSHQTWTVSPVGDLKETSRDGLPEMRAHTQVHEISTINGQALTNDAAGNLTVSEKGQRFVWDAENRLIEATTAPNKDGVHGTVRYLTDALGRRVARTARGSTTLYVYDGAQVVQEITVPHILPPSAAEDDGALANLATVPDGAILMPTWDAEGNRHDVTRINFQPERTEVPSGFLADKGKDYAIRSNTLTYGWTAPEGTPSREAAIIRRFHPMPQYDTAAPMGNGWTWQVALANGSYPVIVVMGDATSRHHTNNAVVQGQAQADPDPYDAAETQSYLRGDFDGYAVQATVTDGVLKIEAGADALDPVLAYIEVGPEGLQLTDEMKKRLADEIEAATQRTGGKPYGKGNDIEVKSLVYSGDYIDEPLMVETKSGRFYVHANQQYSVMAISNAAGEVVERRQYGPYGEIEVNDEGVPPVELSVGYTGREWDADVGMYYFRARWYSPRLGRFVNRDPLTYVDGMSMYAAYFAPGGMDPMGLMAVVWNVTFNGRDGGPVTIRKIANYEGCSQAQIAHVQMVYSEAIKTLWLYKQAIADEKKSAQIKKISEKWFGSMGDSGKRRIESLATELLSDAKVLQFKCECSESDPGVKDADDGGWALAYVKMGGVAGSAAKQEVVHLTEHFFKKAGMWRTDYADDLRNAVLHEWMHAYLAANDYGYVSYYDVLHREVKYRKSAMGISYEGTLSDLDAGRNADTLSHYATQVGDMP